MRLSDGLVRVGRGQESQGLYESPALLAFKEVEVPAKSERQRRFMAADRERAREGKPTKTGMNQEQLSDYTFKPKGGYKKGKK